MDSSELIENKHALSNEFIANESGSVVSRSDESKTDESVVALSGESKINESAESKTDKSTVALTEESKTNESTESKNDKSTDPSGESKEQAEESSNQTANKEETKNDESNEEEKEDEWVDILGSGQLLKKIIKPGVDDSRPQRTDVCTIRYVGKYNDTIVDEGLVTINLGDAELIQGLDFVVPLMNLEEEAEVVVGPRFAFGSEGRAPDIPPDANLHYTVTLISFEPEPLIETQPIADRKSIGNRKRERGNHWYSRKNYTLAIQCYRRSLEYLDDHGLSSLEESKHVTEEEIHSLLEDRIKVYNNLAAAQLKIKAFDAALQSVDNVLRCQPLNPKALFRKGKIMAEKGETEEAISLLKKTLEHAPDSVQAKNELNILLVKQKKDTAREKNLYKKMLGTNGSTTEAVEPLSPVRESRKWTIVMAVGALFSMFVAYKLYKPV